MKKIRVFEAFAGIGAQASALKRLKIEHEIVGISEWFINALHCYSAIHCENVECPKLPSKQEMIDYLRQFTFSRDSVTPINDISRLPINEIENLYITNHKVKNYGSITEIDPKILPDFDVLVYSFPCQDLSTGGNTEGMKEGSGTRSSLLWEIKKMLIGLANQKRLPKYLLMENVKTVFAESNKEDLTSWLTFLSSMGYKNSDQLTLNSKDFGVPQNRKRAFIISSLDKKIDVSRLDDRRKNPIPSNTLEYLRYFESADQYNDAQLREEANLAQLNNTTSREEMWRMNKRDPIANDTVIYTITCNMDRSNTAAMFKYNGPKGDTYRLLTIREAFLLMGFNSDEYERTLRLGYSYRKMNKLIGNSIVVNVLEEIFHVIYADFEKEYKL